MAHFKRGKCRYLGKYNNGSQTSLRARRGLKPIRISSDWWRKPWIEREIDWGDQFRGLKYNQGYPHKWDIQCHSRPRRAQEKQMAKRLLKGAIDSEEANWPLSKKPHIYYW
jgi:hypothetical protein